MQILRTSERTSCVQAVNPRGILDALRRGMDLTPLDDAKMPVRWSLAMNDLATKRRATYDDIINAPDNLIAEILEGELVTSPRPAGRHALAHSALLGRLVPMYLGDPDGPPPNWWILLEPELHINVPKDVVVPDLAGWRRARMASPPPGVEFTIPPDWVCEVLSPSTERSDRTRKLRIYARAGVRHVWLIHPVRKTFEVLRLEGERWTLVEAFGVEQQARAEPFEEVLLNLRELWIDELLGVSRDTPGLARETGPPAPILWDIRRQGRAWTPEEFNERWPLAPEKMEVTDGRLYWSDEDRLLMLGMLLENVGVDAAIRLGDPGVWREAIASVGRVSS